MILNKFILFQLKFPFPIIQYLITDLFIWQVDMESKFWNVAGIWKRNCNGWCF